MPYTPGKNYYLGMDDASRESAHDAAKAGSERAPLSKAVDCLYAHGRALLSRSPTTWG